jgi:hypothetical protein
VLSLFTFSTPLRKEECDYTPMWEYCLIYLGGLNLIIFTTYLDIEKSKITIISSRVKSLQLSHSQIFKYDVLPSCSTFTVSL